MAESLYVVRYSLVPEEPKQKRLELLLQFCEQGRIDEVMFFLLPEEYNRGQWRPADYEPWLEFAVEAREIVERKGMKTSLNPWHTLLHCDRARRSEDLKFRRMVLDTGHECLSVGCPLCEDWQKIFFDAFGQFARAGFKRIWLEDDFRFHNHNWSMGWGGCFCDHHMQVLHRLGTQARTREELMANLNARGIVHPDRKIWMELNGRTYIELARKMRATMDEVDPEINLGLMTSGIPTHAQEGRDWEGLIHALGGPERAMVRPHACGYAETCQAGFFWSFGNLSETLGVLPAGTKTFLEVENAPMSIFAKSNHQTRMQMAAAIDGGCDGLTFDTLDFLGTGPDSEPGMAGALAGVKDKLLGIRHLTAGTRQVGIHVILPIQTPALAPGNGSGKIGELPTFNNGMFVFLEGFGYPCLCRPKMGTVDPGQIYALNGEAVWGMEDETLKAILKNGVIILDAQAARIITERKMGEWIGIQDVTRLNRQECMYSFEEHVDLAKDQIPERAGVNLADQGWINVYGLNSFGRGRTVIKDCFGRTIGLGSFTYHNSTGGRGMVFPFLVPDQQPLHVWARKHWIDRWLQEICGGIMVPCVTDGAWIHLGARTGPKGKTLFLANQTFEIVERLELRVPEDFARSDWAVEFHSRDKGGRVNKEHNRLILETELVGNDWVMLTAK